jgi:hypothetical protein
MAKTQYQLNEKHNHLVIDKKLLITDPNLGKTKPELATLDTARVFNQAQDVDAYSATVAIKDLKGAMKVEKGQHPWLVVGDGFTGVVIMTGGTRDDAMAATDAKYIALAGRPTTIGSSIISGGLIKTGLRFLAKGTKQITPHLAPGHITFTSNEGQIIIGMKAEIGAMTEKAINEWLADSVRGPGTSNSCDPEVGPNVHGVWPDHAGELHSAPVRKTAKGRFDIRVLETAEGWICSWNIAFGTMGCSSPLSSRNGIFTSRAAALNAGYEKILDEMGRYRSSNKADEARWNMAFKDLVSAHAEIDVEEDLPTDVEGIIAAIDVTGCGWYSWLLAFGGRVRTVVKEGASREQVVREWAEELAHA